MTCPRRVQLVPLLSRTWVAVMAMPIEATFHFFRALTFPRSLQEGEAMRVQKRSRVGEPRRSPIWNDLHAGRRKVQRPLKRSSGL